MSLVKLGLKQTFRRASAFLAILSLVLNSGTYAFANPQDGVVTAGNAVISSSGNQLNIHQSTNKAVIDWGSFNINSGETTQFHQPSSSSVTLNRVHDTNASTINGLLKANGHVMVLNPNGVVFGQGSQVDVAGLTATTANISNSDFMAGHMNFSQAGAAGAKIVNNGVITAKDAGLVSLVAPQVENNGVINARLGKINMGASDTFTLDMAGDGLIQVAVNPSSAVGKKIVNTGSVLAEGGIISMTATSAREVVDSLTNSQSSATNMQIVNGQVSLIDNRGVISVANATAGQKGGTINMFADDIALANNSTIDASGHSGGGEVYVGIDKDMRLARKLDIASGATIKADAGYAGNGGKIITWGARENNFQGHIQAKGGTEGGNGGFVEVSSHDGLNFNGTVDTKAPKGKTGTLLLDPTNITISNNPNSSVTGSSPYQPSAADATSNLNVGTLQTALASSNVAVQTLATGSQAGTLTVQDAITWSSGTNLTLTAHSDLIINAPIAASGTLTLSSDGDMAINAALTESTGSANLVIQPRTSTTSIGVAGGSGTIDLSVADLNNIQGAWDSISIGTINNLGNIDVGAYTWNAPLNLRTSTGVISINGAQNMGANNLTIITSADPVINADLIGTGTLTVQQANSSSTTMGIAGGLGTVSLSTSELSHIANGWTDIILGRSDSTAAIIVNAATWNDNLTLLSSSGQMTIAGTQTMGSNNLTLQTSSDLALNGALTGTGTLTIKPSSSSITIGLAGGAGTLALTTAELANITDGWSDIIIGRTDASGAVTVNAATWSDNLTLLSNSGQMTIAGAQNMGSNNLTLNTASNLAVNGALTGTGTLNFYPGTTVMSMGINEAIGTYGLSNLELANITNGWSSIILGRSDGLGAINMNGYTWNDPLTIRSLTGLITISGTQTMGSNDLIIETNSSLALNSGLVGTGTLTIRPTSANTTIGLAGGTGALNLSTIELANISNGWSNVIIGRNDGTANMIVNAATWNDSLTLRTGTGTMTIAGAQNMGANNLTLETNSNLALNSTLTGTGTLTIRPSSASTTIGVAGGAGTLALTTAELANISNGWSNIIIGRSDATGNVDLGAATWNDPVQILTGGNILVNGTQTNAAGANTNMVFASGNFINNAGAGALDAGLGRYLVYSTTPNDNTLGGLTGFAKLYGKTYAGYGPDSVTETGNMFLYSIVPTITVTADNKTRQYGDANPTFTASYSGFLLGDDETIISGSPLLSTLADAFSVPGSYDITGALGTLTTANGYLFNFVNGAMTITPAPLTITVNNAIREYGDANPAFTFSYSGFKNSDAAGDLSALPTATTPAGLTSVPGSYAINLAGGSDPRYTYSLVGGNLTVTPATLTITADNKTRIYGDANPAFTISYSGFKNGDTADGLGLTPTAGTTAQERSAVGTYGITLAGGADPRYTYTLLDGTLVITPRTVTVTANDASITAGQTPTFSASYSNFAPAVGIVPAEDESVLTTPVSFINSAPNYVTPGTYTITPFGASAGNYQFVYQDGALIIVAAPTPNTFHIPSTAEDILSVSPGRQDGSNTLAAIGLGDQVLTCAAPLSVYCEEF